MEKEREGGTHMCFVCVHFLSSVCTHKYTCTSTHIHTDKTHCNSENGRSLNTLENSVSEESTYR